MTNEIVLKTPELQIAIRERLQAHSFSNDELRVYAARTDDAGRIRNIKFDPEFDLKNVATTGVRDSDGKKRWFIGYVLSLCKKYVGSTEPLDDDVAKKLSRIISEHYSDMTLQEIELAFDYALLEKTKAKVDHYNTFSVKYVLGILNSYIAYRGTVMVKAKEVLINTNPTDSDLSVIHHEFLSGMLRDFDILSGNQFLFDTFQVFKYPRYANYIERKGGFNLTIEELDLAFAAAYLHLIRDLDIDKDQGTKDQKLRKRLELQKITDGVMEELTEKKLANYQKTFKLIEQIRKWKKSRVDYYDLVNEWEGL